MTSDAFAARRAAASRMRAEGKSYAEIARELGVSRQRAAQLAAAGPAAPKACETCGGPVPLGSRRYCRPECRPSHRPTAGPRDAAGRRRRVGGPRACPSCGGVAPKHRRYCRPECRPSTATHSPGRYWTPERDAMVGADTDIAVAGRLGISSAAVQARRRKLGRPPFRRPLPSGRGHNRADLTGSLFGRLTVLRDSGRRSAGGHVIWECSCSCGSGRVVSVTSSNLRTGNTEGCGCVRKERSGGAPSDPVRTSPPPA